jgi:dTDP-4-dehydrorhamnose 3,5-epimerase
MIIKKKLLIKGCFELTFKKKIDNRGYFQRIFDYNLIKKFVNFNVNQVSISYNKNKYTFRGFHLQKKPFEENKIILCLNGEIFDYVIDLRKNSRTYLKYIKIKISSKKNNLLFIPKGCAHGFLTLKKKTKIQYIIDEKYSTKHTYGYNYKSNNFPKIMNIKIISKRDTKLRYYN